MNSRAFGRRGGKVGPATSNWCEDDDENRSFGLPPGGAIAVRDGGFCDDDKSDQPDSRTVNEMRVNEEDRVVDSEDAEDEEDDTSEDSSDSDGSSPSRVLVGELDLYPEVEETPVGAVPYETGNIDEHECGERESSAELDDIERLVKDSSTAGQLFEEAIALAATREAESLASLDDEWAVIPSDEQPENRQTAGVVGGMDEPSEIEVNYCLTPASAAEIDRSGSATFGQVNDAPVTGHYLTIHGPEGLAEAALSTRVDTHGIRISDAWMRVAEEITDNWGVVESPADVYDLYCSSESVNSTIVSDELNMDLSVDSDLDELFQEGVEFSIGTPSSDTEASIEAEAGNPDPVFDEDASLSAVVDEWGWLFNELSDTEPSDVALPDVHFPEEEPVNPDEQESSSLDMALSPVEWGELQFPISEQQDETREEGERRDLEEHSRNRGSVEAPRIRKNERIEDLGVFQDTRNMENEAVGEVLEEVELGGMSVGMSGQEGQDARDMPPLWLETKGIESGILAAEQIMHGPMRPSGNRIAEISDGIPGSSRDHAERGKKRVRNTDLETEEDDSRPKRKARNE